MNRKDSLNSANKDHYLQKPRPFFDEHLVEEISIRSDYKPNWQDVQRAQMREMYAPKLSPTQPTIGTLLDRFLLKAAGREPLSTLLATALGLLIAAAQDDPTDWRGWLHGAALAVIGRLMNERSAS